MPDAALGVRDGEPQRQLRQPLDGRVRRDQLAAAQDEADLRSVAVRDDDRPTADDQVGDLIGELRGALLLAWDRAGLAVQDQRVAADRYQSRAGDAGPSRMTASLWTRDRQ